MVVVVVMAETLWKELRVKFGVKALLLSPTVFPQR
jgi:hypothetical protein